MLVGGSRLTETETTFALLQAMDQDEQMNMSSLRAPQSTQNPCAAVTVTGHDRGQQNPSASGRPPGFFEGEKLAVVGSTR